MLKANLSHLSISTFGVIGSLISLLQQGHLYIMPQSLFIGLVSVMFSIFLFAPLIVIIVPINKGIKNNKIIKIN
jgi:hypothetical protein